MGRHRFCTPSIDSLGEQVGGEWVAHERHYIFRPGAEPGPWSDLPGSESRSFDLGGPELWHWRRARHLLALIMAPFAIDVTGNTLNLYDTVAWWDDANHLVNWSLLCAGIGLLLEHAIRPPDVLGVLICGVGALLAVAWGLGEWYLFIRRRTELDAAYQDTLRDETLGATAGGLLFWRSRRAASRRSPATTAQGGRTGQGAGTT